MRGADRLLVIDQLFAFVADNAGIGEGVVGFNDGRGQWLPLVGADEERAAQYRAIAQQVADQTGITIKMLRFTTREHVATIAPRGAAN